MAYSLAKNWLLNVNYLDRLTTIILSALNQLKNQEKLISFASSCREIKIYAYSSIKTDI
jgi:hypothetical protein